MNIANERINLIIKILTIICAIIFLCACPIGKDSAYAQDLDYDSLIYIKNNPSGDGYLVNNDNGLLGLTDKNITEIITEILSNNNNNLAEISFNINNNDENIFLNIPESKTLSMKGVFKSENTFGAVFTLNSGKLYWSNLELNARSLGLAVCRGSILEMTGGKIVAEPSFTNDAALKIEGRTKISGGEIIYKKEGAGFGYGIMVTFPEAVVDIEEGVNVTGHSAIEVKNGILNINGGNYSANKTTDDSTSSGYGLKVNSGGKAYVKGGFFNTYGGYAACLSGDNNALLNISGGIFEGGIIIAGGLDHPKLEMYNSKFVSGNYHDIIINTQTNIVNINETLKDEISLTCIPVGNDNGYRIISWYLLNSEDILSYLETNTITIDMVPEKVEAGPLESNIYILSLNYPDGTLIEGYDKIECEYNYFYDLKAISSLIKGYTILGWSVLPGQESAYTEGITVIEDCALYMIKELNPPCLEGGNDVLTYYDGNINKIIINLSHSLEVTYNFIWQKKNETKFVDIPYADSSIIEVKDVNDSGIYRLKITTVFFDDIIVSYSSEINVEIKKGNYENLTHEGFNSVYSDSLKLGDFALSEFFVWENPNIKPVCNVAEYSAIYNKDSANYNDFYLMININLDKAEYSDEITHESFINIDYDSQDTLASLILEENFYWVNPEIIPRCDIDCYEAYYNADKINYNNKTVWVTVIINKINYPDEMKNLLIEIEYFANLNLLYIEDDYEGKPTGLILSNTERTRISMQYTLLYASVGIYTYEDCSYNADPINYYELSGVTVTVKVLKANYNKTHSIINGIYSPEKKLSDYQLDEFFRWENSDLTPQCNILFYKAIYSENDENYNDCHLEINLVLEKASYSMEQIYHRELSGRYSPEQKLSDFELNEYFRWIEPDIIPVVDNNEYEAIYNADMINYHDFGLKIKLNLKKAIYDMSNFKFCNKAVIYNGEKHYIEGEGILPSGVRLTEYADNGKINSGVYIITAKFAQDDTINYDKISNKTAWLTINKAPSVIIAEKRQSFIYDGNEKTIIASVNNTEQAINYSLKNSFFEKGLYKVTLSTTESMNYLASSIEIIVSINPCAIEIGDSTIKHSVLGEAVAYGKIQNASGIDRDVIINMEFQDITDSILPLESQAKLHITLSLNGEEFAYKKEVYTVTVLLPKELQNKKNIEIIHMDASGNLHRCQSDKNGGFIVFRTEEFGDFILINQKQGLKWWGWLLIGFAALGIILAIASVTIIAKVKKLVF